MSLVTLKYENTEVTLRRVWFPETRCIKSALPHVDVGTYAIYTRGVQSLGVYSRCYSIRIFQPTNSRGTVSLYAYLPYVPVHATPMHLAQKWIRHAILGHEHIEVGVFAVPCDEGDYRAYPELRKTLKCNTPEIVEIIYTHSFFTFP